MTTLQHLTPLSALDRPAPRLLNLGCGTRFHAAWVNLDLNPSHPSVARHDVTAALPFPVAHFDAVYQSHLLEHLPPRAAPAFLRECHRVLRPGGILRLAVPDLEQLVRLYLHALTDAWRDAKARAHHHWLVMELYDQTTREQPGGAMLEYLCTTADATSPAWQRLGADAVHVRAHQERLVAAQPPAARSRWRQKLRGWLLGSWRERLVRRLLGREYELLQLGRFRRGGEVHHWMYDRVSLRSLLSEAGFVRFRCVAATDSAIPDWDRYRLDEFAAGQPAKPDSLFAEAHKP